MTEQPTPPAGRTFKLFSLFNAIVLLILILFFVSAVTLTGTKAAGTFEFKTPVEQKSP